MREHICNIFSKLLTPVNAFFRWDTFFSVWDSLFSKREPRKKVSGLTWLLLLGIVVYFVVVQLCLRHDEPGVRRDSVAILAQVAEWHQTGEYITEGRLGTFVPPFAPYVFRLPLLLGLPLEQGILRLLLLFGMSVPVLSFLIARECGSDDKTALVLAALIASNPYLHDLYNSILRDPVFIPIALLALYLIMRYYNRPGILTVCGVGVVSALALLTRYEGILLPALFATVCSLTAYRDHAWKRSAASMLIFLGSWAVCVGLLLYSWNVFSVTLKVFFWRFSTL